MYADRYSFKADARERLRAAAPRVYIEGLLYALISAVLLTLAMLILSARITPEKADQYVNYMLSGQTSLALELLGKLMPSTGEYMIAFALILFLGVISAGFSIYAMNLLRGKETSLWNLLDGFARFFPLFLLTLLMRTLTWLWMQLLIIPGILAAYRYRQAVYLMLDHPELSSFQCILLSGQIMRGHKLELFLMDLSFLGWALLAILLPLFSSAFAGWIGLILGAVAGLAVLARLLPYYELSCVGFYEAVKPPVVQQPSSEE